MKRERLDRLVVVRGMAKSRSHGQRLIMAGLIKVDGHPVFQPSQMVDPQAKITVTDRPLYVSRGGEKLAAALQYFNVDPTGKVCVDIGASTGGFTDCLLQHGAAQVYAVDVGTGQLDWQLRNDERVRVREGFNARYLTRDDLGVDDDTVIDLVTIDVSFISLQIILPAIQQIIAVNGEILALVKPQFEAGKDSVSRGGVIRDPAVHQHVLQELRSFIAKKLHWSLAGAMRSPLRGPAGNMEFFFYILPVASSDIHLSESKLKSLVGE
ncbi:TlyA family RNA methyltransferase [Candidatus Acetothermia bacterium]|jgi:23S rRNA (cytidine1920-2'-O)/16S rRNA (cytidine1409-2'-O)-methyltransferase|nr:TlyA family RNA methyltransferase [Candidatus Acetothermia bacterium]MCI2427258.1 TlyA family RNA methyltransferase [Candidatus Acetothermia bacterium]MCI2428536.1 TlyA family RNA methyltransferase [Candidatus Acetothermia bacterium]